ncbi:flavin containing polyamine oxidase [Penicillium tannophilum]|nr:flavin containing polyamine oxidase [Penicillium tannophilum]
MHSKRILGVALAAQTCSAAVSAARGHDAQCTKTTVAILGGGMAGVAAAQALSNSSIDDFVIIEYQDKLGGRVHHTTFGKDKNGDPYTVELGANWVQGLGSPGGPENPIWTLAKKWGLNNTYSNYSSILTYNETGYTDFSDLLDEYETKFETASDLAGTILTENLQDMSVRSGLSLADWKPKRDDMTAQAVEWWEWDWEDAYSPEQSSLVFGVAGSNLTFNQFSDENNYVWDQRGFNRIITGEASTFLKENDPRVHLNSKVTKISYSEDGVTVHKDDGSCVSAAYAVCTFSLGVLQSETVSFTPTLPDWKKTSIEKFSMGTYTKIFLQFNETFWPEDTQYFLYASPTTRGSYPVWQSLSAPGFIQDSNIIFVTLVHEQAYRAERQTDEQTKEEVMKVLREMYPDITIPEPTAFMYPRWSTTPWAYGSYSNWPPSTTLEMHENFRANLNRLWFAGEATSAQYFGFLHGAWFEGRNAGEQIAALLQDECANITDTSEACGNLRHYETLYGSSPLADYSVFDGWSVSSFYSSS